MKQLHHPFTAMVSGPSFAGKTTFVIELINNSKDLIDVDFRKIIWCYSEQNAIADVVRKLAHEHKQKIRFVKGVPDEFHNENNVPQLVILDDLMNETASAKRVAEVFTRGSHHRNISVILITQNIFFRGPFTRDISLNAKYIAHFKSPRDSLQFSHLARQIYAENSADLVRVYNEICNKSHGYIFFDLTQTGHNLLRFRTDIFNKDYTTIYCNPNAEENIQHETIAGEQACVISTT